jgi:hypothetical protein
MMVDNKPYHIEIDGTLTVIENVNVERLGEQYKKINFEDDKDNMVVEKSQAYRELQNKVNG